MNTKKEIIEDVKYIVLGIVCALLLNKGLGLVFATDLPVVAVVSDSMDAPLLITPLFQLNYCSTGIDVSESLPP